VLSLPLRLSPLTSENTSHDLLLSGCPVVGMDRRHGSPGLGPRHDASSRVQKPESTADKLAALKARVSAAIGSNKAKPALSAALGSAAPSSPSASAFTAPSASHTSVNPTGGLNVGLHPALEQLGQWKPTGSRADDAARSARHSASRQDGPARRRQIQQQQQQQPGQKSSDLSTPPRDELGANPYLDASGTQPGRPRQSRQLIFNQKGKYIQQANALRRQAALEALKKKIAAQTRKAGIDDDIDVERAFVVEEPPQIEWWDEGLIDGKDYGPVDDDPTRLRIDSPDSIVTAYIQHPVAIEPPQDRHIPAPKPMYLTHKETKKLRRQRRMADMKEEQAKIRLGLIPAPQPKVKKGNLMRVLGEEAVKDPTAVEARVNREIAERHENHVQTNEERRLTPDQRHEKLERNQELDASRGLRLLVFVIDSLANGQHRYRISVNGEQLALTGVVLMHPRRSLVIAEGGSWAINKFRKLMLQRIDWTENAPTRDKDASNDSLRQWLKAEDEAGNLRDLARNRCQLLFEGDVKERAFRKWGSRVCETDAEAREALQRSKMESFWQQAKTAQS
jgi:U4/U6 small nuclear ribonucleoprotein PRP3